MWLCSVVAVLMLQLAAPAKVVGTIEAIKGDRLWIRSESRFFSIYVDEATQVRKGRVYRDVSPLSPGDEVSVRCRQEALDRLVAVTIWAQVVRFRATVHRTDPSSFDIIAEQSDDPQSAYRKGYNRVWVYPTTRFGVNRKYLTEGHEVSVVGVETGGGNVDALRVVILNAGLDVPKGRM